ncbi:MAG: hypothetical protein JKX82_04975 [Oleispira sp.]|nr:hypothetical protein [Oleispira sp.]
MPEETSYIAYKSKESDKDNFFNVGKYFDNAKEAAEFFGIGKRSIKTIARDRHAVRGRQPVTWMIFHENMSVIDVESELERRLQ